MTWFEINDGEWEETVSVDSEVAAEAICRESGESWALANRDQRETYRRLAEAAIVAIGGERQ